MLLKGLVMALSKLGDYIELVDNRNTDGKYSEDDVRGISTSKVFIETKANLNNVNLNNYKVVNKNEFAYVADTSRRGDKIGLAFADSEPCIISSIYTVFKVKDTNLLIPRYLMMFFNRPEFDRYARYNSWGSARETFSWEDFCDTEIDVPEISIQKQYVSIYEGLLNNLHCYEKGLDDLELAYEAIIEKYRRESNEESIIHYIEERTETNNCGLGLNDLKGVGGEGFIIPRQKRDIGSLSKCGVFYKNDFVYNPSVLYAGAIALNTDYDKAICTEEYIVFHVKDESILRPEYLFMWLKRKECGRFIEFKSVDSVRNRVYFRDLEMIKIPVVSITEQDYVVNIYNSYASRKKKVAQLKMLISSICPILIRGSVK